jgi:hypothetical protein
MEILATHRHYLVVPFIGIALVLFPIVVAPPYEIEKMKRRQLAHDDMRCSDCSPIILIRTSTQPRALCDKL